MKSEILTTCEFAASYEGKLCITGVTDIFHALQEPARVALYILFRVRYNLSEAGRHDLKISMVDQDGKDVMQPLIDTRTIRLPENSQSCVDNGIMQLRVIFPKFGEYSVEMVVDGVALASMPVYVSQG